MKVLTEVWGGWGVRGWSSPAEPHHTTPCSAKPNQFPLIHQLNTTVADLICSLDTRSYQPFLSSLNLLGILTNQQIRQIRQNMNKFHLVFDSPTHPHALPLSSPRTGAAQTWAGDWYRGRNNECGSLDKTALSTANPSCVSVVMRLSADQAAYVCVQLTGSLIIQ